MKKLLTLGFSLCILLSLHAQKLTKTNIVGKWQLAQVEMNGIFNYNVDTDSLSIGEAIKAQAKEPQQLAMIVGTMKPQLAVFKQVSFEFRADGTAMLNAGMDGTKEATYTVDEENSSITTLEKGGDGKKETIKAEMMPDNKLRFRMADAQGDIIMTLKKAKP